MEVGDLLDVLNCMEHGVYNNCKDGKCIGCGDCCSDLLPVSDEEIHEIKKYIKEHDIHEQKHLFNFLATKTLDLTCPFLDINKKEHKCVIYPVRPLICKKFMCNVPPSKTSEVWKTKFNKTHYNVSMRETFYGVKNE